MRIDLKQTAQTIKSFNNIIILTHSNPDGDTLGSGFALCRALQKIGKNVKVVCGDEIPRKYTYITDSIQHSSFDVEHVICVDVADKKLIGKTLSEYKERIELCIDHHPSNLLFAEKTLLDDHAAATTEIIYNLIEELEISFDKYIANCIYTGLTTDTGCFRYANVTAKTHNIAARMIQEGADSAEINRIMFETKSKSYIAIEKMAMNGLEFYFGDKCAFMALTQEMFEKSNCKENEVEGLSSLPRQIEGVVVGVTLRERVEGGFKVSLRTHDPIDASAICRQMGGGGHARAAGCQIKDTLENSKRIILQHVKRALEGEI